jgi:hypothetical protein
VNLRRAENPDRALDDRTPNLSAGGRKSNEASREGKVKKGAGQTNRKRVEEEHGRRKKKG